ncbi:MAG: hypothetical protein QOH51_3236 [Acidobacteriota bacterium]|jgi:hypothetical protein|nr:hypothetical protein [Acidobacteriota bacterium]
MRSPFRPFLLLTAALLLGVALSAPEVKAQTIGPGQVLISEFRLSGPNGPSDEYIEFYCNLDVDCDVSNYNVGSVDPANGSFEVAFPANTVIPARGHLLLGDDSEYSLPSYATLDLIASISGGGDFFIDNEGIQLRTPDDETVIDSVGFTGGTADSAFIEGTGLERATSRPADQYAYVRKMGTATGGIPQDTNDNSNDFVLVSVTGAAHPGITAPPVLGAPGPQALTSPPTYDTNSQMTGALVEPGVAQASAPNRVRTGSGDSGTLSIRRSITNNTTQSFDYLSFRVIDITTLNSPVIVGGQAQLRLVTSGDAETFENSQGRTVVIRGTVLEFDDGTEPNQPNGGGLNSTVHVALGEGETIAPGQTVDVQFLLNVVKAGNFRFFVNIEAFPSSAPPATPSVAGRTVFAGRSRGAAVGSVPPHLVMKRNPSPVVPPISQPVVNKTTPAKKKKTAAAPKPPAAVMVVRPSLPGSVNAAGARSASGVEGRPESSPRSSSPKLLPRRD